MAHEPELWIVGAGPAALVLAEACVERGISIGLVAPDPSAAWQPNYGIWLDDAEALGVGALIGSRWARAEARFAGVTHTLERGYGLLDDRRLQLGVLERCRAGGATIVDARVEAIEHDDEGVTLVCEGGQRLRGRLVVDASGYASPFLERQPGPKPGHQVAWGELWAVEGPLPSEVMTFMDWTPSGPEEGDDGLPPTFLYAMPLAEDRLFVEETVLTARLAEPPSACFEPLARRLHRRLDGLGIVRVGAAPIEVERCIIPMGGPLPRLDQRTLGFGGAAGMVHPATGYMLTHALRRRARVAEAIAEQLRSWVGAGVGPGRPSRAIWRAIWSADELRAWRLYGFGMEVLASLDRAGIDRFFAEFFTLPDPRWRGFVSANDSSAALMTTMLRYYAAAPGPIRRRLSLGLFGPEGRRLVRGLLGSSR